MCIFIAAFICIYRKCIYLCSRFSDAQMAELVDAYVSGAYVARRAGSSPVLGTTRGCFIDASSFF